MRKSITQHKFVFAVLLILGAANFDAQSAPATATATAPTPATPGYVTLASPQPTASGNKVEVIEVFSYGCIHCAQFQPYVDSWSKHVDKSAVQFSYLPAPFNPYFRLMARGYYAAESMGVAATTHQQVFDALFVKNKQVNSAETLADLYASLGVNRDTFMKTAQSIIVESQIRRADDLIRAYEIDGTPTVIVAGKYRVTGETAGGHDKVFAVVDALIAKERKSIKPATKPAVKPQ
jgi:thiol:disulfide interchange protein DsbA